MNSETSFVEEKDVIVEEEYERRKGNEGVKKYRDIVISPTEFSQSRRTRQVTTWVMGFVKFCSSTSCVSRMSYSLSVGSLPPLLWVSRPPLSWGISPSTSLGVSGPTALGVSFHFPGCLLPPQGGEW